MIDFKKRHGFICSDNTTRDIHGLTVTHSQSKHIVRLQSIIVVDETEYLADVLAIPNNPEILDQLIKKLLAIRNLQAGSRGSHAITRI